MNYNVDVAILIPTADSVKTEFAVSLTNLVKRLAQCSVTSEIFYEKGSLLPSQRSKLVAHATKIKDNKTHARQALWLDSDMMFHPDIYHRLNQHNTPIAAADYAQRTSNNSTVTHIEDNTVHWTGMGCMLVNTQLYIDHPELAEFEIRYDPTLGHIGEDVDFCNKARAAGYSIKVDNSIPLGHVGYQVYTP